MRGSGRMISTMARERKAGSIIRLCILESLKMGRKQAWESLSLMEICMKETLWMGNSMEEGNISLLSRERSMMENFFKIV